MGSGSSGGSTGGAGSTSGGGSDTGGSSSGGGGVPDGGACTMDSECASNRCYVSALGGICGECTNDADCSDGGCSPPNPLTMEPSVCNQGEQGGGCETDDACCGIGICNTVVSV